MKWQRALSDGSRLTQFYFLGMGKYTAKYLICQEKSPFVVYSYFLTKFGFVLYLFHVKHFLYFHCKNNMMPLFFAVLKAVYTTTIILFVNFIFANYPTGKFLDAGFSPIYIQILFTGYFFNFKPSGINL